MPRMLLKNALVYPIVSAPFRGDVLVSDGKIERASPSIKVDSAVRIIDCGGRHLLPGPPAKILKR
ncbi:Uncharacterised protein [Mycobacteroides abscessus subsp. abscessus]|nr:Uncharacterised protein [Mycobacteroides abscessus subsp. abscessus]